MNKIETKILNCSAIREAEKNMVFTARLTQRGHLIHNMEDLVRLYNRSFTNNTVRNMGSLPHPTIQKFTVITVAVVGASRRFLSQITRHQNEVKFTSASLQYSNHMKFLLHRRISRNCMSGAASPIWIATNSFARLVSAMTLPDM